MAALLPVLQILALALLIEGLLSVVKLTWAQTYNWRLVAIHGGGLGFPNDEGSLSGNESIGLDAQDTHRNFSDSGS